jgi:hypothetical protein
MAEDLRVDCVTDPTTRTLSVCLEFASRWYLSSPCESALQGAISDSAQATKKLGEVAHIFV